MTKVKLPNNSSSVGTGHQVPSLAQVLSIGNDGDGQQIKNIADPTNNQDAVTLSYLNSHSGISLTNGNGTTFNTNKVDWGGTLTGSVNITDNGIHDISIGDGVNNPGNINLNAASTINLNSGTISPLNITGGGALNLSSSGDRVNITAFNRLTLTSTNRVIINGPSSSNLTFTSTGGISVTAGSGQPVQFITGSSTISMNGVGVTTLSTSTVSLTLSTNAAYTDSNISPTGIVYGGTGYVTQTHSLADKEYSDAHLFGYTFTNSPINTNVPVFNGTNWTFQSVLINPMTTLGDIIYENSTPAPTRLAGNTTTSKQFLSQTGNGSTSAAPIWSSLSISDIPSLAYWGLTGTSILTGATIISGTSTNTLQYSFNSLGTIQTNGAGIWLQNSTAATSGNQQISPLFTWEGQGFGTGANTSQSVKYAIDVLPVQAATNPSATWRLRVSVNGAAYSDALTYNSSSTILNITGGQINATSNNLSFATGGTERGRFASGDFLIGSQTDNARLYVLQAALSASQIPGFRLDLGAHTSLAAGSAYNGIVNNTVTLTWSNGSSTVAIQALAWFKAPTYNAGTGNIITDAVNAQFDDPIAGTGTVSNVYSLLAAKAKFTGNRILMSGLPTSSAGLPSGALWNNSNVINIIP